MSKHVRRSALCLGLLILGVGSPARSAPDENPAAPPPARHSLLIGMASLSSQGGQAVLNVQGQADFPDNTTLEISLGLRGEKTKLEGSARVVQHSFVGTCATPLRILPAYYVVTVTFESGRQDDALYAALDGVPRLTASYPLSVGTQEEIAAAKKHSLDFYVPQLEWIETQYQPLRKAFLKLVDDYKSAELAAQVWDDQFKEFRETLRQRSDEAKALADGALCPVFPDMHRWIVNGFDLLAGAQSDLRNGLIIDLSQKEMKKIKSRTQFLKETDQYMYSFLRTARTRILLEKDAELRDLLMFLLGRLFWLYDQSAQTFSVAHSMDPEQAHDPWTQFMKDVREQLDALGPQLKSIEQSSLKKEYPELVNAVLLAPADLKALWGEYDQAILRKVENGARVRDLESTAYSHIVPVMECLGYESQAVDPGALGSTDSGYGSEADPSSQPSPDEVKQAKIKSADIPGYIRRTITALEVANADDRVRMLRIITCFREQSLQELKAGMLSGATTTSLCCAVGLAWLKDSSGRDALRSATKSRSDDSLKALCVGALGMVAAPEDSVLIADILKQDPSALVRASAASAMGSMGSLDAVPRLIDGLADPEMSVRVGCKSAIETLTERSVGFMPNVPEDQRNSQRENVRKWWQRVEAEVRAKRAGPGKSK